MKASRSSMRSRVERHDEYGGRQGRHVTCEYHVILYKISHDITWVVLTHMTKSCDSALWAALPSGN